MQCPMCSSRNDVEIDIHSDGFAKNVLECGACGTVWTATTEGRIGIIRNAA